MDTENERVLRIQWHHRATGTDRPWTREQFHRLCRRLKCTPYEVAALFCVTERQLDTWLRRDEIPAHWALHLVLLDQAFWRGKYAARSLDPVPVHEVLHENENQKER